MKHNMQGALWVVEMRVEGKRSSAWAAILGYQSRKHAVTGASKLARTAQGYPCRYRIRRAK